MNIQRPKSAFIGYVQQFITITLFSMAVFWPYQTLIADPLLLTYSEDDFLTEIPIVLSASRLAQPQSESPVSITVITRDMIDASSAQNIPDLLRFVPGFQVGYYDANKPVATYHGMADVLARRIQVLIDGRSVYIPSWGGVPWADLPITLDDIERIEVIRGPNAAAYGSNSFLAVVSIKTRHAVETHGNYFNVRSGDTTHDVLYRHGAQTNNLDYRITFGLRGSNGYDGTEDNHDERLIKARLDYQLDDKNQLFYQTGLNNSTNEEQGSTSTPTHDFFVKTANHHVKWERLIDDKSSVSLQYYYNLHDVDNAVLSNQFTDIDGYPVDPFQTIIDFSIRSERHDIEFNHYYQPNAQIRTVWGLSHRLDSVTAQQLFDTSESLNTEISRLFGHTEWRMSSSWLLNAGLMFEDNQISGSSVSPQLSITHPLNPNETLRIGISSATRAPSTFEEKADVTFYPDVFIGGIPICQLAPLPNCQTPTGSTLIVKTISSSGGLDFERITSRELGYFGEFNNHKITVDIKLFHDTITDLIIQQDVDPDDFDNSQGVTIQGVELGTMYRPMHNILAGLTYANISIQNDTPDNLIERFDETAPQNSYGLFLYKNFLNGYSAGMEYFQTGTMRWADNYSFTPNYDILNIKLAKQFKTGNENYTLALIMRNLAGEYNDYDEYSGAPISTIDRRILVELKLNTF